MPTGFVPTQDKQYLVAFAQLPDGASLDRTEAVIRRMSDVGLQHPGVRDAVAFPGLSISGFSVAPNAGIVFFALDPFEERETPNLSGPAIAGVWLQGSDNNIFTQIGLIVLVALACKNAILIVEFAKHKQDEGMSPVQAAIDACRLRLRPILMTSIAFIAGVVPLVTADGAGAEMRRAMGWPSLPA